MINIQQNRVLLNKALLAVLLVVFQLFAQGQEDNKLRSDLTQTRKAIARNKAILGETKKAIKQTHHRVRLLEQQVELRNGLLEDLSLEVHQLEKRVTQQNIISQDLASDLNEKRSDYARLIAEMYQRRNRGSYLYFILSAKDLTMVLRRFQYLIQLTRFRRKQADSIASTKRDLDRSNERLRQKLDQKENLQLAKEQEHEHLLKEVKGLAQERKRLESSKKIVAAKIAKDRKAAAALEKKIRSWMKGNKVNAAGKKFAALKGKLRSPVDKGTITRKFGLQRDPVDQIQRNYKGIDMVVEKGSEVFAIHTGKVTSVLTMKMIGKVVLVDHGGYFSLYSNLKETYVNENQEVLPGTRLGKVTDQNGLSVFHFQIWKEGQPLDPQSWVKAAH